MEDGCRWASSVVLGSSARLPNRLSHHDDEDDEDGEQHQDTAYRHRQHAAANCDWEAVRSPHTTPPPPFQRDEILIGKGGPNGKWPKLRRRNPSQQAGLVVVSAPHRGFQVADESDWKLFFVFFFVFVLGCVEGGGWITPNARRGGQDTARRGCWIIKVAFLARWWRIVKSQSEGS